MKRRSLRRAAPVLALLIAACSSATDSPSPITMTAPSHPAVTATVSARPIATQTGAAPSPGATPVPTPSATPSTLPSATIGPTASPSLPVAQPIETGRMGNTQWRAIVTGQTAYYPYGIWAPDGAHLLVINFDGGRAELLGRDGSLVRNYDHAVFAAWIDSERFLLLTYSNAHSGEEASAVLGSVASRATVPEQVPFGDALPNGRDAVAFVSSGCDMGCDQWSYAVWSPENGTTARQSGEPVAWSADGQRLFVIHGKDDPGPPTGAPGRSALVGWLEVASWPGLDSIAKFHDQTFNDDLDLVDPSGRYVAFLPSIDTALDLSIFDTSNGDVTDLHIPDSMSAWATSGLVSAPTGTDPVTTVRRQR